ncbi:hypothetical protein H671_7g17118 [Cricetulus griseus]|nr:hypothetical protein H671_7g17118 [Cricetulus griseus]
MSVVEPVITGMEMSSLVMENTQLEADTLFGKDTPILFTSPVQLASPAFFPKCSPTSRRKKALEGKYFLASAT